MISALIVYGFLLLLLLFALAYALLPQWRRQVEQPKYQLQRRLHEVESESMRSVPVDSPNRQKEC